MSSSRFFFARSMESRMACASSASPGFLLFSAALKYENFYGTQFHPEKSGAVGAQILRNFLSL